MTFILNSCSRERQDTALRGSARRSCGCPTPAPYGGGAWTSFASLWMQSGASRSHNAVAAQAIQLDWTIC
ncbi:hypothetical protein AURDEDRAFT_111965 [Auricularia subglabra TFB-10046 SS5]|nr:hypothetical protein AURDEDRAFT_111965 [Auricularia subglabra TFB-10046 SS5]